MQNQNLFIKGKTLNEFNHFVNATYVIIASAFFIGIGSYGIIKGYGLAGIIFFVVGLVIYLVINSINFIKRTSNKKTHKKEQNIDIHLGIGWFLLILLNLIVISLPKNSILLNINVVINLSTAIIISVSVFSVLLTNLLYRLGRRSMTLFNSMLLALIIPIFVLILAAFNVWDLFIWVFLEASLAALFSLFGTFLYFFKKTIIKQKLIN